MRTMWLGLEKVLIDDWPIFEVQGQTPPCRMCVTVHNTLTVNLSLLIEQTCEQHERHASGDPGLCFNHIGLGAGVLHPANRLLEGLVPWWNRHHHSYLLVQPVEDLRHRFNRSLQLQRLPLHAGTGWSAAFFTLITCDLFVLIYAKRPLI